MGNKKSYSVKCKNFYYDVKVDGNTASFVDKKNSWKVVEHTKTFSKEPSIDEIKDFVNERVEFPWYKVYIIRATSLKDKTIHYLQWLGGWELDLHLCQEPWRAETFRSETNAKEAIINIRKMYADRDKACDYELDVIELGVTLNKV